MTEAEFRRIVHYRAGERCEAVDLLPDIDCWGILEVNHIKRRPHCTPAERVDPNNGNLLCAAHHQWVSLHSDLARELGLYRKSWEEVPGAEESAG